MFKGAHMITRIAVTISAAMLISACDKVSFYEPRDKSYQGCLRAAVEGSHNLSLADIRALCSEASGTSDPFYKFENGKVVPNNAFTACYEKERVNLKSTGAKDADHLAMLICKYGSTDDQSK